MMFKSFIMLLYQLLFILSANIALGLKESTVDLIKSQGYPAETHYVQTSDGYILTIHRFKTCGLIEKKTIFEINKIDHCLQLAKDFVLHCKCETGF